VSGALDLAAARRLEERALNASGAFRSLLYDGWLLGYRPGPTKRLRCINPFYPSTLPLADKVAHCIAFYAAAKLPAIFRLMPFSEPAALDGWLEADGWTAFERTRVLHAPLSESPPPALPDVAIELIEPLQWAPLVAPLLDIAPESLPAHIDRQSSYPLPHVGAVIRRQGDLVACGLLKVEDDHAGLFAVHTAKPWRGCGFARAIVAMLLAEARRHGATRAYLQVSDDNAPALAVYDRFGFTQAYTYWYRRRGEERLE
jgi:GNAT superfamily N-acetyltransferase